MSRWIHIVAWKTYELFGLLLGPDNFIDLDSSSDVKFSRHLIVIMCNNHDLPPELSKSFSDVLPSHGPEHLFRNNIEVGHFVSIIVNDVLLCEKGDDMHANNVSVQFNNECNVT